MLWFNWHRNRHRGVVRRRKFLVFLNRVCFGCSRSASPTIALKQRTRISFLCEIHGRTSRDSAYGHNDHGNGPRAGHLWACWTQSDSHVNLGSHRYCYFASFGRFLARCAKKKERKRKKEALYKKLQDSWRDQTSFPRTTLPATIVLSVLTAFFLRLEMNMNRTFGKAMWHTFIAFLLTLLGTQPCTSSDQTEAD